MKTTKMLSELQTLSLIAKERGIYVGRSRNGGGWVNLAKACGIGCNFVSKIEAKAFVREYFGGMPAGVTIARHESAKKSAATLQKKINPPRSWVPAVDPGRPDFLETYDWRRLRMMALQKYGRRCMCCGASPDTGAVMHVDHIKPRKLFPALALDLDNLQILCHECNHGKGNWDQTDWRDTSSEVIDSDTASFIRAIARQA